MSEAFTKDIQNVVRGGDCGTGQPLICRVWETCKGNARVTTTTETFGAPEVEQARSLV